MASDVKHLSLTNEQYTPPHIISMVREVLGSIDLDPASSKLANQMVQAREIITLEDGPEETFNRKWSGNVFVNPPGGQKMVIKGSGFRSNPVLFWSKMMHSWLEEKTLNAGIFLGFTLEVLQSSQSVKPPMLRFPLCVPSKRISFLVPRGVKILQLQQQLETADSVKKRERLRKKLAELAKIEEELVPGEEPPHANTIVFVPPRNEYFSGVSVPLGSPEDPERPWTAFEGPMTRKFWDVFHKIGYVRI